MSGQLLDLFWRAVRGSGSQQVLIDQIAQLVSRSSAQTCQDLVTAIKKVIKSKPESPQAKLQALKVLIPAMKQTGFRAYAADRLLTRLGIVARRAKESPNAGLWGTGSEQSQEALEASREFGRVLLEALRKWAEDYGEESSVFRKTYEEVGREKDREELSLEEVRALTLLLREVVLSCPSQTSSSAQVCTSLQFQVSYLRSQLPSLAVRMDELRLQEYLDALEAAEAVLEEHLKLPINPNMAEKFDFDFDFPQDKSEEKQEFDFDMHWEESSPPNAQFPVPQFDFEDAQFAFSPAFDPNSKLKSLEEQKETYLKTIENNEKSLEDQLGQIKSLRFQASDAVFRLQQVQNREKELHDEVEKLRVQLNAANKEKSRSDVTVKQKEVEMEREIQAKDLEIGKLTQKISLFEEKLCNFEPKYIQIQHENSQFRLKIDTLQAEFLSQKRQSAEEMAIKQKALDQAQIDLTSLVAQVTSLKLALSRDLQSCGVQTFPAQLSLCTGSWGQIRGERGRGRNLEIGPVQGITIRPKVLFPRLRLESVFQVSIQSNPKNAEIESLPGLSIPGGLINPQIESIPVDICRKAQGQSTAVTSTEVENPFEQDITVLMTSLPAPELRKRPEIANKAWIQGLYQSEQGLLYEDQAIEVRFRTKTEGKSCLMWLLITPKDTETPSISALSASGESGYSVQISKQVLPSPLLPSDPAKVLLCVTALTPFAPPPTLDFVCSATQVTDIRLALPVSFLRFTQPLECEDLQEVLRLWEELKSTQYSESFEGLKAEIRSMGLLRAVLACESRFKVLTSLQLPELQRTWLLMCGQVASLPVLVLVALRRDASGGVMTAYASGVEVRKTLVAFVLGLIT